MPNSLSRTKILTGISIYWPKFDTNIACLLEKEPNLLFSLHDTRQWYKIDFFVSPSDNDNSAQCSSVHVNTTTI